MASKSTGRSLQSLVRQTRLTCECARAKYLQPISIRQFSASTSRSDTQYETDGGDRPRWSYTPEKMKAPYPWRIKDTEKVWECNSDPARLDQFYINFLGRGGDKVLTEEVKWLAITHKSFDQGRRGFNDRLAFFGIVSLTRTGYHILNNLHRSTNSKSADESGIITVADSDTDTITTRSVRRPSSLYTSCSERLSKLDRRTTQ